MSIGAKRWLLVTALASTFVSPATATVAAPGGGGAADRCLGADATRLGTPNADVLVGTSGDDVFAAGAGDDTVYGRGGNDRICGGNGADKLFGGPGNDHILGGAGRIRYGDEILYYFGNVVDGGSGNDVLDGGTAPISTQGQGHHPNEVRFGSATGPLTIKRGSARVSGLGIGTDRITGFLKITATRYDDQISTTTDLLVFGGGGDDTMTSSGKGFTGLFGGSGDDLLTTLAGIGGYAYGGPGSDRLLSGPIGNSLNGGPGPDRIVGRGGADRIGGVGGADRVLLGTGADELFLDALHAPPFIAAGPGKDYLTILPERRSDILVDFRRDIVRIDGVTAHVSGFDQFESFGQRAQLPVKRLIYVGTDREEDVWVGSAVYNKMVISTFGGSDAVFLDASPRSTGPRIFLGKGNDFVSGLPAGDYLIGGDGHDRLYGRDGEDRCQGESLHNCEIVIATPARGRMAQAG